jgi:hypothetical protein
MSKNKIIIDNWVPAFAIDKHKMMCFSMTVVGSRRRGKSNLIMYLYEYYWKGSFDIVLIYTTETYAEEYRKKIKTKFIFNSYNEDIIKMFIGINKEIKRRKKKPLNILLLFDDTASKSEKHNSNILDIYCRGRHYNISVVYISQASTMVDNVWKNNSDYMIIFKQNYQLYNKKVVENYIRGFYDIEFKQKWKEKKFYDTLFFKVTNVKYRALVIDFIDEKLYQIKAKKMI